MTNEAFALLRHNAMRMRREQAVREAQRQQQITHVPWRWRDQFPSGELPRGSAFISTAYLKLPRLLAAATPLDAAMAARNIVDRLPRDLAHERLVAHEITMFRRISNGRAVALPHIELAPVRGSVVATAQATITRPTGSTTTTHVATLGTQIGAPFPTTDGAAEAAQRIALSGSARGGPLAVVRTSHDAWHVAQLDLTPSLHDSNTAPLVERAPSSGASLTWRPTTSAIAAVLGVDGIVWL
jgi:hypothetical protein